MKIPNTFGLLLSFPWCLRTNQRRNFLLSTLFALIVLSSCKQGNSITEKRADFGTDSVEIAKDDILTSDILTNKII